MICKEKQRATKASKAGNTLGYIWGIFSVLLLLHFSFKGKKNLSYEPPRWGCSGEGTVGSPLPGETGAQPEVVGKGEMLSAPQ